ncbi:hypothetical protein C8R45DRAFT_1076289, partial [Mycena sanguinolenta]
MPFRLGLWSPHNTLVIGQEQTLISYEKFALRLKQQCIIQQIVNRIQNTSQKQISASKDKIIIVPFWDTTNSSTGTGVEARSSQAAEFDCLDMEEAVLTGESVIKQKLGFDKTIELHIEQLKENWPENDAGKKIYTDNKG